MDRRLLEALRMVKGQGQMSAKDKYGWHPPLSDEGDAMPMPNQPRDISKSGGSKNPFLEGKSAADFGQDAFGEPVPDKLQMAKVNGAMRLPAPQQASPTSMKDMMGLPVPSGEELVDPMGDQKTQSIARGHPGHMVVSVDPSSYVGDDAEEQEIMSKASAIPYTMPKVQRQAFKGPSSATAFQMGGEDDPSGAQPESSDSSNSGDLSGVGEYPESIPMDDMTDEIDIDTGSNPDQAAEAAPEADPAQKSALQQYIDQMNGEGEASKDRDLSGVLNAQQKMNSDMGLYKLLFASANKIGSHAGQQSSDEPFNSFADGAVKSNDKRSDLAMKERQLDKKRQDDKLRALMFQQKQADDEKKYQAQLTHQGKQLDELANYHKESLGVQRESNQAMNDYHNDLVNATAGTNGIKAKLTQAQIDKMQADIDDRRNPKPKPISPLDAQKLERDRFELNNLKKGLDKDGHPIKKPKSVKQEAMDRKMADTHNDWVNNGQRAIVEDSIGKLKSVAAELKNNHNSSGPILGVLPSNVKTFLGSKGPAFKNRVMAAIQSSFKDTLGGAFSKSEGEMLMATAWDDSLPEEENLRNIESVITKMEAKKKMQDDASTYFEQNDTMGDYQGMANVKGGQAPGKQSVPPPPPGMVNIQGPDGDIRAVPKESAQKYLSKGGKLVQ